MNAVPLLLLYMFSKREARGAEPHWPSRHHPPPRRARRRLPHHSQHAAESHQASAHHAATNRPAHHAPAHHAKPFANLDFSHPAHHDSQAAHHAPGGKPFTSLDFTGTQQHDAAPPPVEHAAPPAPETNEPEGYDIARLQRILVGLGWRGHLTTKGSVIPELRDGLFGPVTHDDWVQSAHKRNLDTTFVRLGPRTAQVDPHTFDTLRAVARSMGATVDGRRLRIP